jgi:hypothetical protein
MVRRGPPPLQRGSLGQGRGGGAGGVDAWAGAALRSRRGPHKRTSEPTGVTAYCPHTLIAVRISRLLFPPIVLARHSFSQPAIAEHSCRWLRVALPARAWASSVCSCFGPGRLSPFFHPARGCPACLSGSFSLSSLCFCLSLRCAGLCVLFPGVACVSVLCQRLVVPAAPWTSFRLLHQELH